MVQGTAASEFPGSLFRVCTPLGPGLRNENRGEPRHLCMNTTSGVPWARGLRTAAPEVESVLGALPGSPNPPERVRAEPRLHGRDLGAGRGRLILLGGGFPLLAVSPEPQSTSRCDREAGGLQGQGGGLLHHSGRGPGSGAGPGPRKIEVSSATFSALSPPLHLPCPGSQLPCGLPCSLDKGIYGTGTSNYRAVTGSLPGVS